MSDEAANNLAVKIARLLQTETRSVDLYSLQKSIEKINERLAQVESKINNQISGDIVNASSFNLNSSNSHPSQEKFARLEDLADAATADFQNEKPCPYEPTGKPCDHCSMCNSRGF